MQPDAMASDGIRAWSVYAELRQLPVQAGLGVECVMIAAILALVGNHPSPFEKKHPYRISCPFDSKLHRGMADLRQLLGRERSLRFDQYIATRTIRDRFPLQCCEHLINCHSATSPKIAQTPEYQGPAQAGTCL